MFEQMVTTSAAKLRRRDRMFKVRFVGEGGHDVGGLYRDLLTNAAEEIQTPAMSLFVQPPDGEAGKFFPSTRAVSTEALQQFEVIGTIMGFMATDLSNTVSLDMSRVVWKRIVGEEPTTSDVALLDSGVASKIKFLGSAEVRGYDEENLSSVLNGQNMVEKALDGQEVELVKAGRSIDVKPDNLDEYLSSLEKHWYVTVRSTRSLCGVQCSLLVSWPQVGPVGSPNRVDAPWHDSHHPGMHAAVIHVAGG